MKITPVFQDVSNEGDHGYAHICPDCAKLYSLTTSDTCCNGNLCLVEGCNNETSLVHYLWDYRYEVQEHHNEKLAEAIADKLLTVYGGKYEKATLLIPAIPGGNIGEPQLFGSYCKSEAVSEILHVLNQNQ